MTAAPRKPNLGRARDGGDHGPRQVVVVDPDNTLMMRPGDALACERQICLKLGRAAAAVEDLFEGLAPRWAVEALARCRAAGLAESWEAVRGDRPVTYWRLTSKGLATGPWR